MNVYKKRSEIYFISNIHGKQKIDTTQKPFFESSYRHVINSRPIVLLYSSQCLALTLVSIDKVDFDAYSSIGPINPLHAKDNIKVCMKGLE